MLQNSNWNQARSQVLRFGGQNAFLGRQDFCFYLMFKKSFLGTTQFGGAQKYLRGTAHECLPVATGLTGTN